MESTDALDTSHLLDSMNEGVYVCDTNRRIAYWSEAAERITGWSAAEVVGRCCYDNVLCHVDKDGHRLCGEEHCPLHRSMVTGKSSGESLLVYAQSRSGSRVPMHVSVAPLRDASGTVIGGVETFRDASAMVHDLERAKAIQQRTLDHELPADDRVSFTTHYIPHDIIGGDYFAIESLDADRYGIMLADVMGHGVAAALYTMYLSQLWDRHHASLTDPAAFTASVNHDLAGMLESDSSFATATCGVLDLERRTFRFAGAGGPPILRVHGDGRMEVLESPGFPLGLVADAEFEETSTELDPGDRLLLFTDGALEVMNSAGNLANVDGVIELLRSQGYPRRDICMGALEESLLRYSSAIRLQDDLTLIEIRLREVTGRRVERHAADRCKGS